MTQFIFYSDLHLEFGDYCVPKHDNESNMGVVLAGDIHTKTNAVPFLIDLAARFKFVIYVLGNHEHYGESVLRTRDKITTKLNKAGITNVHVLENETVILDDVAFIGATLWTNANNGNPLTMYNLKTSMSDFKVIKYGRPGQTYRKFIPEDMVKIHQTSVEYIFKQIAELPQEKKVVVTHHAPSYLSVPEQYIGDCFNPGYCTEYGHQLVDDGPDIWIHGHLHDSSDYDIGNTRIISNPRGYAPGALNPAFEDSWLIRM